MECHEEVISIAAFFLKILKKEFIHMVTGLTRHSRSDTEAAEDNTLCLVSCNYVVQKEDVPPSQPSQHI